MLCQDMSCGIAAGWEVLAAAPGDVSRLQIAPLDQFQAALLAPMNCCTICALSLHVRWKAACFMCRILLCHSTYCLRQVRPC